MRVMDVCMCVSACVYTSVCTNISIGTCVSPVYIAMDTQTPMDIAHSYGGEKKTASSHSPLPPCKLCRGAFAAGDVPVCVCVRARCVNVCLVWMQGSE